jgi:succinate dehydrogenase / fumarate reductase flavoprotein subunit
MDIQYRSKKVIREAHEKIDSLLKDGEMVARPLQRELRNIMWDYCGVVRTDEKLKKGLDKVATLKESVKKLDVRPDSEGFEDLMLAFDLEAAIMSAEATMLGAKARKESRGAHQRSDYEESRNDQKLNYIIKLQDNGDLKISTESLSPLSKELEAIINSTKDIEDFEGMLLE